MIKKTARAQAGAYQTGWMEHFQPFSGLSAPPLLSLDDMLIRPNTGLGLRRCRDRILLFYIAEGVLTHGDSMNHHCVLHEGDAFCLDSGSGIFHSELNHHSAPLHLIQISFAPLHPTSFPRYAQGHFFRENCHGHWLELAGPQPDFNSTALSLNADASVFCCMLDPDASIGCSVLSGRQGFLFLISGSAEANGIILKTGDSLQFFAESLSINAFSDSHFILIDLPLTI